MDVVHRVSAKDLKYWSTFEQIWARYEWNCLLSLWAGGGLRHEDYHVYKINCEPFNAEPLYCSKALRLLFSWSFHYKTSRDIVSHLSIAKLVCVCVLFANWLVVRASQAFISHYKVHSILIVKRSQKCIVSGWVVLPFELSNLWFGLEESPH